MIVVVCTMSTKDKRILVLSVDKDNDVGHVTGVTTPLVGRDRVLSTASLFAIKSPEDSDTNSIFAALKTFDSLASEGVEAEIAVIAGLEDGGFKADMKILAELESVLGIYPADGVIFVSDGAADEQAIPIIQSKVPVISVKRVFVQQQKSVEEAYVLMYRYLKKLAEPQYSKIALGVPGIFILATVVLYLMNLLNYVAITLGLIAGAVLIVKGFNMDSSVRGAWSDSPIKLISALIAAIVCVVAVYRGIATAIIDATLPEQAALFASLVLTRTIDLLLIGVAIYVGGRLVAKYLDDDPKIWREVVGLVALIFIRQMVIDVAPIIIDPKANLTPFLFNAGLGALICTVLVLLFSLTPRVKRKVKMAGIGPFSHSEDREGGEKDAAKD